MVLVSPSVTLLLCSSWSNAWHQFSGLRSAPFIFNSVAEAVKWILEHNCAVSLLFYYLDDFLTMGPATLSGTSQSHMDTAFNAFARSGLPLHWQKCGAIKLARLLRGIRRSRSSAALTRFPVSNRLMGVLQSALSTPVSPVFDHVTFEAACCFFRFSTCG